MRRLFAFLALALAMLAAPPALALSPGVRLAVLQPPPFTPLRLGDTLKAWWDPNVGVTQTAGAVSAWRDRKAGLVLAQASGSLQPVWSAASFNSRSPGLTCDGTGTYLELSGVPGSFPTSTDGWVFVAVQNTLAGATTPQTRTAAGYGANGTNGGRRIGRTNASNVNRAWVNNNTTTLTETGTDFSGYHILGGGFAADGTITGRLNGAATSPATAAASGTATLTSWVRVCASPATTLANYWAGQVADVIVTGPLTTVQRNWIDGWLAHGPPDRPRGLQTLLPASHPYRWRRP